MLSKMTISFSTLAKVLNLPEGVDVVAVKDGDHNCAELRLSDKLGVFGDKEYVFDMDKRYVVLGWKEASNKGSTRGEVQ